MSLAVISLLITNDNRNKATDRSINHEKIVSEDVVEQSVDDIKLLHSYCTNPHKVTCSTSWPSIDPTGKVMQDISGEVGALRKMRSIIKENPSWSSGQVQEKLTKSIYTEKRRKKIIDVFNWVQNEIKKYFEEQNGNILNISEKKRIINRLAKIKLELPPPASIYADAADIVTKNTVYYERTSKGVLRLRVGGAYLLNTTSWFNIVYTLAHELAHSIDPCEFRRDDPLPVAYEGLISCFIEKSWVQVTRAKCGKNEQVSEVFADWLAAEITGRAIESMGHTYSIREKISSSINAVRDLCEQSSSFIAINLSLHQTSKLRIGSILGLNPKVMSVVGCENKLNNIEYCHFKSVLKREARIP